MGPRNETTMHHVTILSKRAFLKQLSFFVGVPAFIWQVLFFYVPLLCIIGISFFAPEEVGRGFTLAYYAAIMKPMYLYIIFKSALLALLTGIFCFLIGYPLAYFIAFSSRLKTIFLFGLILPFWTNFLLHIYAWFFVLERGGVLNNLLLFFGIIKEPITFLYSPVVVMIVMVHCYLPFMVLPIYSILERFDRRLLEASADLGASNFTTITRIMLPLSASGSMSGFFLVAVPAFGEFVIPGLLGGDTYVFVGTVISQYILGAKTMQLGAAFTVVACACLVLVSFCCYVGIKYWYSWYKQGHAS